MGGAATSLAGVRAELFTERVLYLPSENALFVADLHLGKGSTSRSLGLYLPGTPDVDDLAVLTAAVEQTASARVFVLGDLFHDGYAASDEHFHLLDSWLETLSAEVVLIVGNHDRKALALISELPIGIVHDSLELGSFLLSHEPLVEAGRYTLCGHLHPGIHFRDAAGCSHRAKAFWKSDRQLVLPAFGSLTSSAPPPARPNDKLYICAETQLLEVTAR